MKTAPEKDHWQPADWPDFMSALEPEASESSVVAAAPTDIALQRPLNDLPASISAWSGEWSGWAGQGRSYDIKLIVERVSTHDATVVCVRASDSLGVFSERVLAQITGMGDDPSLFTSTVTSPTLAKYFNGRGWMVVFPQRRGRGKSYGLYDEGFEPDRSRYSDDPQYALPGFEHALQDLACVVEHLLVRADVDRERLLIGGHSRGGFLALACAGARPKLSGGVLNFVGGWVDEQGPASEMINPVIARRGAAFAGPTVWLYAENDPFYSTAHSRSNFDAFVAAGGQGQFHVLETLPGQDGHHVVALAGLWGPVVDHLLGRICD
ncbi:alpha/beta hydrolase [Variovorax paradoxus]|nr:alpha/beta hydrolase [Variovorax paradoxus]